MVTLASGPASSLAEEKQVTRNLLELLQQEQGKLIEASITGLPELIQAKALAVTQLTTLTKTRHALLDAAGFAASERGMRDWIAVHQPADTEWLALVALGAEAREMNRINGMLIGRHMMRNQTELNILQGKTQRSNLYGADGQSTGSGRGRGLAIG
ncbi:flagellar protein FlgN [Actimicrobium sp. CCI2.3]|uniref:flagella synthesis protein FlgN n=1 Tax=Actimicrobium sp. CCI2.3 TaxID=3048616 RepID=UPI002AB517F8|nr:flagellar protein FlgN [Actimicrobium sp. CCI2.3]MDY7575027.1 flagellar protein FlgN [Actimicrobium sp. CCI2.3]MEB0021402.1 flagellar protein FlgN [Actimicrobium sp. CCI2.3]